MYCWCVRYNYTILYANEEHLCAKNITETKTYAMMRDKKSKSRMWFLPTVLLSLRWGDIWSYFHIFHSNFLLMLQFFLCSWNLRFLENHRKFFIDDEHHLIIIIIIIITCHSLAIYVKRFLCVNFPHCSEKLEDSLQPKETVVAEHTR